MLEIPGMIISGIFDGKLSGSFGGFSFYLKDLGAI